MVRRLRDESMSVPANIQEEPERSGIWSAIQTWGLLWLVFSVVYLLTFNPLLASAIPYLNAGWPAARTAFWLYRSDPWRSRAAATFCFHLGHSAFSAGACGVASMILCIFFETQLNIPVKEVQLMTAVLVMLGGCLVALGMGFIGAVIAWRNGVRVFVVAKLHRLCKGDFSRIVDVCSGRIFVANPAFFVLMVATLALAMIAWGIVMLGVITLQIGDPQGSQWGILATFLMLPITILLGALIAGKISKRVIANSPIQCWGVAEPEPELEAASSSWYQSG